MKDDVTATLTEKLTVNEVANICKNLPNNKEPGYDSITYECVKHGGNALYECLTHLFNHIIELMYIPAALKHSIIIPLHKGKQKPRNLISSYRGVSLTPIINKLLEKLIMCRLKPWLTRQNYPPPLQQAGREKTNCVCLSYVVQEAIRNMTRQGSKVYGCFLDIKSAYDVINWNGLLLKLANIGITHKLWHFLKRWLLGSTAQILVQGQTSDSFDISRSIKQGGLLSTFFFVILYSDIHEHVIKGKTQALTFHNQDIGSPTMADDTLLLSATAKGLQVMINNADQYGKLWRLEFSPSKTKCITFSRKRGHNNTSRFKWFMGDQPLDEVSEYNYLGIILSADGSSKTRTNGVTRKAYSSLGALKAAGFHSDGLSPVTCSKLWQRMLIPSMLYGCEVWGRITKHELNKLEITQKRIGKHIQGLHRRTHDEIVRGLLGWTTVEGMIDKCKLNFVYKLMNLPPDNIIKHIFLSEMYCILFIPTRADTLSITYELWSTILKYDLSAFILEYLTGGIIESKKLWKQISNHVIHEREEIIWREGLLSKRAFRFIRIHNELKSSILYFVIKDNMHRRKQIMNVIKLLSYPEQCDECICHLCNISFTDTIEHYVMRCQGLIEVRNVMWDNILDAIDCEAEAKLLSMDDVNILDVLLSKTNNIFEKSEINYKSFICIVAQNIDSLISIV